MCVIVQLNNGRGAECVKIPYSNDFSGVEKDPVKVTANNNDDEDDNEYVHDLAIKLKREFADDVVSDLFATSYGLEKVARVGIVLYFL